MSPHPYVVYLLHLDSGIKKGRVPIRHYLGATQIGLLKRLERHKTSTGAALLKECNKRGIEIRVARVWHAESKDAAFKLELALKRRRRHAEYCLFCSGRKALER